MAATHNLAFIRRESEATPAPPVPLELPVPLALLGLSDPSESRETEERL